MLRQNPAIMLVAEIRDGGTAAIAVQAGADTAALRRLAEAEGMRTLRAEGERLIASGTTSREEVMRVTS